MACLIETCKLNAVDPYAYLRATLTAIANGHTASPIDDLMPWAFQKPSTGKPDGARTAYSLNHTGNRPKIGD